MKRDPFGEEQDSAIVKVGKADMATVKACRRDGINSATSSTQFLSAGESAMVR